MKLSLTRQQRKALFAGEHPRITVPSGDLFFPDQRLRLSTKVEIVVVGIEDPEGDRVLLYTLADHRPRLLRARTRSAGYEEGLRDDLVGAELIKASEASGYTHSPGAALRGSGEEVSRADQERFKKEAAEPGLELVRGHRAEIKRTIKALRDDPLLPESGSVFSELRFAERKVEKVLSKLESRINETARRSAA